MLVTDPFAHRSWAREAIKAVSRGWWVLLVIGLVSIFAGGIILLVDWSVSDLAVFLGTLFFVRGIFTMVSIPMDGSGRGWAVALGLLEVGIGIAAWVWPDPTLLVIAALVGWWVLFGGLMTIVGSIGARRVLPYWGLFLALGIAEAVVAVWLLNRPDVTLIATVLAIGLWSILYGIVYVVAALELKDLPKRFDEGAREVATPSYANGPMPAAHAV
jgi:uncharacterized membrane protein HdeD (DUF308 family)